MHDGGAGGVRPFGLPIQDHELDAGGGKRDREREAGRPGAHDHDLGALRKVDRAVHGCSFHGWLMFSGRCRTGDGVGWQPRPGTDLPGGGGGFVRASLITTPHRVRAGPCPTGRVAGGHHVVVEQGHPVEEPVLPGHVDSQPEQRDPDVQCDQAPRDERQAEGVDRGEDVRCDSVPCGHGDLLAVGPVRLTEHGPRRPVVHRRRWREHLRIESEPQAHDADGDQGPPSDPGVGPDRGDECRRARDAGVDAPRVGVSLPRAVAVEAECPGHSLFHRRHGPLRSRGAPTVGASWNERRGGPGGGAPPRAGIHPGEPQRDGHSTRVRSIEGW